MTVRTKFGPYLHVDGAGKAIAWYVEALGALVVERYDMPDGTVGHCELDFHGFPLYLADCPTGIAPPSSYRDVAISLFATVPDVDAFFARAIEEGARVERPLKDQEYGERNGGFVDPFGHVWFVSTPLGT
jgi:PhnB protein